MILDEHGLILQAQQGDIAAFELLIQPHQAKLPRIMLAITANCKDAEDCLQEALINAYRALSSFRGESAFSTWLYRIALNTACNWIRNESRKATTRSNTVLYQNLP